MSPVSTGGGSVDRVAKALEAYFDAQERGERVDILSLCDGDVEVARRVECLLERSDDMIGDTISITEDETAAATVIPGGPPIELGDFQIVSMIGRGAMGDVYVARQRPLGRMVALKVVRRVDIDEESVVRFEREAKIMALVDHPNVVPIHGVGSIDVWSWIAMRWLSGPSLDQMGEALAPPRVARIGAAIARALAEAHGLGVVHRDIKPANIIFDGETPYLADFGLARASSDVALTREGVIPGTLPYVAPECLRGAVLAADRVDIYALGATLYEALSGRRAFDAENDGELIAAILFRDPPPLRLPSEHRDLETIIMKALAKEPERRFATALELAEELERYLDGRPILSRRVGVVERLWLQVRRRKRSLAILLVILMLAAWAGIAWWIESDRSASDARRQEAAAHAAIDARELDLARALAGGLKGRLGAESQRRLEHRLFAVESLESLLDQLQDRAQCQNEQLLRALAGRVEELNAVREAPVIVPIALALTDLYRGDMSRLRDSLRACRNGGVLSRSLAILEGISEGKGALAESSLPNGLDADDHVFASLAMRFVDYGVDRRNAEVDAALRLDRRHYRARYAHIVQLIAMARFDEARGALDVLVRQGQPHPALHRHRAFLELNDGDLDGTLRELDAIPAAWRSPYDEVMRANVALRKGDRSTAMAIITAALVEWPQDVEITLFHGQLLLHAMDLEAARAELHRSESLARLPSQRHMSGVRLLTIDLMDAARNEGRLSPKHRDRLAASIEHAREISSAADDPMLRSQALWLEGKFLELDGRVGDAKERWRAAVSASAFPCNARLELASYVQRDVLEEILSHDGDAPKQNGEVALVREVTESLHSILDLTAENVSTGLMPITDGQRRTATLAASCFAYWLGDQALCARLVSRAIQEIESSPQGMEGWKPLLTRFERWAKR